MLGALPMVAAKFGEYHWVSDVPKSCINHAWPMGEAVLESEKATIYHSKLRRGLAVVQVISSY